MLTRPKLPGRVSMAPGAGKQIMSNLGDKNLQAVASGTWDKYQHVRRFGDGTKVTVHTSVNRETLLVWDIKIKYPE